ncbi:MAG TPA: FTR1 family protein [Candidatus Nitrosotalea sp.]|nr:FTR1 family protein [Candidatus Nitrosotalea sp.]
MKVNLHYLAMFVVMMLIVSPLPNIHAETDVISVVLANKEIVNTGLHLVQQSIEIGDYLSAQGYSKETSDLFGESLQTIRNTNPDLANEVHITLVDIETDDSSSSQNEIVLQKIAHVKSLFDAIPPNSSVTPNVLVNMLSAVDELYQNSVSGNDKISYEFSHTLMIHSEQIFQSMKESDLNQNSELKLYFDELKSQIENKEPFVKVGNTVTEIQNNLLGTKTSYSKSNLYDMIRDLYKQVIVQADAGNYDKAKELAITAYLDNFEFLEPDLRSVAPDFEHKLELNMREDLRSAISNHESPLVIKQQMAGILANLDKAEGLVSKLPANANTTSLAAGKHLAPMGSATNSEKEGVQRDLDSIRSRLQAVLNYYKAGNYQEAYTTARSAYLDSYEHVEIPLRVINPDFTSEVETHFSELRNLINSRADYSKVEQMTIEIKRNLDESERQVSGTGTLAPTIAFSSSFAMIFREGLESVLIIGAILTYLEASRNTKFKPFVYYGALAAMGATAITWFIASYVIQISGAHQELIEALAALSATAVLFYVSFWILNKIETKKWMEFVKAKVWQASASGGVAVFVMLSFFTVYREGFETVLFYQAMFGFAKYLEIYVALGFILGLGMLGVAYYAMRKLGRKLPLRWLFGLTMGVGAYLSVAFIGDAIQELQILDLMPTTNLVGVIPRLDINLATMTGIHPTLETILGQIALLVVYLVAGSYVLIGKPRKEEQIAKMRKSRAQVE